MNNTPHSIVIYSWLKPDNRIGLTEKHFSRSFSTQALLWFDNYVISHYDQTKKVNDATIPGYHYEFEDYIVELR
jgi:hypothetical protein